MGIFDSAKRFLHIAAVTGTVAGAGVGMEREAMAGTEKPRSEKTTIEVKKSPTEVFVGVREKTIGLINHGMTDPGSFGTQKGRNWEAVLEGGNENEPLVVKITVKSGGKEVVQRYEVTEAEITSDTSDIQPVYSFATDKDGKVMDIDELRIKNDAEKTLAAMRGENTSDKDAKHIAMNDGE